MKKILLEFSEIYQGQRELRMEMDQVIDCRSLSGTDCYCDPETQRELQKKIVECGHKGIHLMDSGNYHYISRLFLETCECGVSLVVADNHTDMQPPALLPVLSCGSWLLDTLREVPNVKEVFLIGPSKDAIMQIPSEYRDRISILSREEMETGKWKRRLQEFVPGWPVYYSIDKDILSPSECLTNWDQGTCTLSDLIEILSWFERKYPTEGVDICGEPCERSCGEKEVLQSTEVSRKLISVFDDKDRFGSC